MESLLVHVLPWLKTQRAHSKLLTMKDVQLIRPFSLDLHPKQMHCNQFMKHSVLLKATVLYSNVMWNIVWAHVSRPFVNGDVIQLNHGVERDVRWLGKIHFFFFTLIEFVNLIWFLWGFFFTRSSNETQEDDETNISQEILVLDFGDEKSEFLRSGSESEFNAGGKWDNFWKGLESSRILKNLKGLEKISKLSKYRILEFSKFSGSSRFESLAKSPKISTKRINQLFFSRLAGDKTVTIIEPCPTKTSVFALAVTCALMILVYLSTIFCYFMKKWMTPHKMMA